MGNLVNRISFVNILFTPFLITVIVTTKYKMRNNRTQPVYYKSCSTKIGVKRLINERG